jgi:hypothetical protein
VTVVELALAYAAVGAVLALVAAATRRASALDALLLVGLWPLYGPVLVGGVAARPGTPTGAPDEREEALVVALRKAAGTPLAGTLPDEAHARALAARMRDGRARLAELDRVLARPDLDEAAARARARILETDGAHPGAVATALRRVHTIRRLRDLRRRFAADLEEVDEVVTQLTVQLELVSFAGGLDTAAELAADLCARVEALDDIAGQLRE